MYLKREKAKVREAALHHLVETKAVVIEKVALVLVVRLRKEMPKEKERMDFVHLLLVVAKAENHLVHLHLEVEKDNLVVLVLQANEGTCKMEYTVQQRPESSPEERPLLAKRMPNHVLPF